MRTKDCYEDGKCPDCYKDIPDETKEGEECKNCGHVFWNERDYDLVDVNWDENI